ncbi:DegT/DnrJ/EryC1/StrS family aminotransferase [Reyranella sp.]|uniref:DegT/DnrJ/EryC1/StrS family aminotransferase n=1 Tax=Reyranella sp. TaxID=1929291 RepID=UPI003BAA182A
MAKHDIPYVNLPAQGREQLDDLKRILEQVVLKGSFVGTHDDLALLEKRLAEYCGTSEAVALNSGTDALFLAMKVAGIGEGDEVITPPNSFVASTATIVQVGAKPVFADVLADQNIDPEKVARAITPRTRAIMPVHLTGRVCQMDEIMDLAERHGLVVIEDAAQAIGSMYKGRLAGSIGHFGCFSAHPLKNLNALGDGGFVTTNDSAAADRMRRLRAHGMADRQTIDEWGLVSRMDTLQAAVLGYRLDKLPDVITKRRANAALYQKLLRDERVYVPSCRNEEFNTFHTFVIQVDRRDELQAHLRSIGIKTAIHYPVPIHLQPAAKSLGHEMGDFPMTERQADRILTLPVNQYMTEADVETVANEVLAFVRQ